MSRIKVQNGRVYDETLYDPTPDRCGVFFLNDRNLADTACFTYVLRLSRSLSAQDVELFLTDLADTAMFGDCFAVYKHRGLNKIHIRESLYRPTMGEGFWDESDEISYNCNLPVRLQKFFDYKEFGHFVRLSADRKGLSLFDEMGESTYDYDRDSRNGSLTLENLVFDRRIQDFIDRDLFQQINTFEPGEFCDGPAPERNYLDDPQGMGLHTVLLLCQNPIRNSSVVVLPMSDYPVTRHTFVPGFFSSKWNKPYTSGVEKILPRLDSASGYAEWPPNPELVSREQDLPTGSRGDWEGVGGKTLPLVWSVEKGPTIPKQVFLLEDSQALKIASQARRTDSGTIILNPYSDRSNIPLRQLFWASFLEFLIRSPVRLCDDSSSLMGLEDIKKRIKLYEEGNPYFYSQERLDGAFYFVENRKELVFDGLLERGNIGVA